MREFLHCDHLADPLLVLMNRREAFQTRERARERECRVASRAETDVIPVGVPSFSAASRFATTHLDILSVIVRRRAEFMKNIVQRALRLGGVELHRINSLRAFRPLAIPKPGIVIDVGANDGQFALAMRRLLPEARILSLEPLPDCAARLRKTFKSDANFRVIESAVGNRTGIVTFNRSAFSPSSSVLSMAEAHRAAFPATAATSVLQVPIDRLDSLLTTEDLSMGALLKIDVQGLEHEVLAGADRVLSAVNTLVIETSFVTLYEGQLLFDETYHLLRQKGLVFSGSLHQLTHPETGEILQMDAIFKRRLRA